MSGSTPLVRFRIRSFRKKAANYFNTIWKMSLVSMNAEVEVWEYHLIDVLRPTEQKAKVPKKRGRLPADAVFLALLPLACTICLPSRANLTDWQHEQLLRCSFSVCSRGLLVCGRRGSWCEEAACAEISATSPPTSSNPGVDAARNISGRAHNFCFGGARDPRGATAATCLQGVIA